MKAVRVRFEQYRNLENTALTLADGVNVLWGENAQGKSNILEGIYYFARGKSFRGVSDKLLIRTGAPFGTVSLTYRGEEHSFDTELTVTFTEGGRKRVTRGGAPLSGVKEMLGSFRAVLFAPEHLSLVSGAPAERRSFLDVALAQLSPAYIAAMTQYTRALGERNALLRAAADGARVEREHFEIYAEQMSRSGSFIASLRASYTERLDAFVRMCFSDMTGGRETPSLTYLCANGKLPIPPHRTSGPFGAEKYRDFEAEIFRLLTENLPREIAAGSSLYGIQRDDIEISLNGEAARLYASQGQTRSLSLAMKLGEGALSRASGGAEPVYLLDDVFSELDRERRAYLLSSLGERQVIITSCEPDAALLRLPGVSVHRVTAGTVRSS